MSMITRGLPNPTSIECAQSTSRMLLSALMPVTCSAATDYTKLTFDDSGTGPAREWRNPPGREASTGGNGRAGRTRSRLSTSSHIGWHSSTPPRSSTNWPTRRSVTNCRGLAVLAELADGTAQSTTARKLRVGYATVARIAETTKRPRLMARARMESSESR
jgi:hypothetical protein